MHVSADPDVPVVRAHRRASHDGHEADCAGEVDGRFIARRGRVACRIAVALAGVAQAVGTCAFVTPGLTQRGSLDARGLAGGRLLGTRAVGRVAGPQMVRGAQIPSTGAEGHGRRNVWPKTVRKWKATATEKDVQTADAWEGTRAQTQRGSAPRVSTQRVSAPRESTQRESTPRESSVSTQESYIKRWGGSAKGIPSASLPTQPRYDDEEPSSIPFRGGWAETYSVAWDMAGGDAIPTRIPFLFGTGRGAAPSVAIMAPAESTSLYKRIPFLAGSQRQQEKEEAQLVVRKEGMGEETSAREETELKAARERSRFAIAEYRQYLRELEQARSAEKEKAQASASAGPAMPAEYAGFDAGNLCSDLDLDDEARVFKVGKKDQASFAWFGDAGAATGVAEWTVRVERQSGVMFIGVALEPRAPILGFARNLQTPAWMIGSYGYVCKTGGTLLHHQPLTDEAKAQMGDTRVGALRFSSGSCVRLRLDRGARTLQVRVNDLSPFVLRDVDARARPFVNLAVEGDCVSLLAPDGGAAREEADKGTPAHCKVAEKRDVDADVELQKIRREADAFNWGL